MSRAISIAGVRPLGWLARARSCMVQACPARLLGAGASGLAPHARARHGAGHRSAR